MRSIKEYYKQMNTMVKGHVDKVVSLQAEKNACYDAIGKLNSPAMQKKYTSAGIIEEQNKHRERIREINREIEAEQKAADADAVRFYNIYMDELDKAEEIEPEMIDTKFMQVAGNVRLTAKELNARMKKYGEENNHTMCRFVQDYADNQKIALDTKYIGMGKERESAQNMNIVVSQIIDRMAEYPSQYEKLMGENGLLAQSINE